MEVIKVNDKFIWEYKDINGVPVEDIKSINGYAVDLSTKRGFILEITLTEDTEEGRSFAFELDTSYDYDCVIDWGDGNTSTITSGSDNSSHIYSNVGTYEIEIKGKCEVLREFAEIHKLKVTDIIFWGNRYVLGGGFKSLERMFVGCVRLKSFGKGRIPAHKEHSSYVLYMTFEGCTMVGNPHEDLLWDVGTDRECSFHRLFDACNNITEIPSNLLKYSVMNTEGSRLFFGTSITEVPKDLFKYQTNLANCYALFRDCYSIKTIPADLFKYCSSLDTTDHIFAKCVELEEIPDGLFRYNSMIGVSRSGQIFRNSFSSCRKAKFGKYIFYAEGEQATRFINCDADFASTFYQTGTYCDEPNTAPDLWNCSFKSLKIVSAPFSGHNNTTLTNYDEIPDDWK